MTDTPKPAPGPVAVPSPAAAPQKKHGKLKRAWGRFVQAVGEAIGKGASFSQ